MAIVLISISKTVFPGGNQALGRLSGIKVTVLYKTGINYLFVLMKVKVVVFQGTFRNSRFESTRN